MQVGRATDGPDLAVAEEAAERDVAEMPAREIGVVIRPAVEVHAASEAREEERAGRLRRATSEHRVEVLGRRPRGAQVELHDHAGSEERAARLANRIVMERPITTAASRAIVVRPATLDDRAGVFEAHSRAIRETARSHYSAEQIEARSVIISGGVACNSGLRAAARSAGLPYPVYFPTPGLSTDNAAMIAAAAFPKLARREFADFDIAAQAGLTLA